VLFFDIRPPAVLFRQMRRVLFFRNPPASCSYSAKAIRFIFCILSAKRFSIGKRDQIHFLYSVSKVILNWQTRPDSFFVFRQQSDSQLANATRVTFCNPVSKPFSLGKCDQIHFCILSAKCFSIGKHDQIHFCIPSAR
jgi:hypothetical protein